MDGNRKIIAQNKKAYFNYGVEDKLECGIVLQGTEVKSVKAGSISFADSFALIEKGEVWVQNMQIAEYSSLLSINVKIRKIRPDLIFRRMGAKKTSAVSDGRS